MLVKYNQTVNKMLCQTWCQLPTKSSITSYFEWDILKEIQMQEIATLANIPHFIVSSKFILKNCFSQAMLNASEGRFNTLHLSQWRRNFFQNRGDYI